MDMLVLADSDGVVDMTHEAIARITNVPLEWVKRSIAILEAPDTRSRSADHDGARIARLDDHRDWGWVILNYDKFREIATDEQRRVNTRERVRRHRENRRISVKKPECNAPVTPCNAYVTPLYASAYASVSDPGGGVGEGRNVLSQLQAEVCKHYNRALTDAWSYLELESLAVVCRRSAALEEWTEILAYYRLEGAHPRHSVRSLLENWGSELDKARSHKPEAPGKPEVESIAMQQLRKAAKGL